MPASAATSRSLAVRSPRRIRSATASATAGGAASCAARGWVRVASDSPGQSASNGCGSSAGVGAAALVRASRLARLLARGERLARLLAPGRGHLRALARRLRLHREPLDPRQRGLELCAAALEEPLRLACVRVQVVDRVQPCAGCRLGGLGIGRRVARRAEPAVELVLRHGQLARVGCLLRLVEQPVQGVVGPLRLAKRLGGGARVLARGGCQRAAFLDEQAWRVAGVRRDRSPGGSAGRLVRRRLAPVRLRTIDRHRDGAAREGRAWVGHGRARPDGEPGGRGPDVDGADARDRRASERRGTGRRGAARVGALEVGERRDGSRTPRATRRAGSTGTAAAEASGYGTPPPPPELAGGYWRVVGGAGRWAGSAVAPPGCAGTAAGAPGPTGTDAAAWTGTATAVAGTPAAGDGTGVRTGTAIGVGAGADAGGSVGDGAGPSFQAPSSGEPGIGPVPAARDGSESVVLRRGLTEFGEIVTRTCPAWRRSGPEALGDGGADCGPDDQADGQEGDLGWAHVTPWRPAAGPARQG